MRTDLLFLLHCDGGATLDASTLEPVYPTEGYAVGLAFGTALAWRVPSEWTLDSAVRHVASTYPAASFVGLWLHDGIVDVDPVAIVATLPDALTLATVNRQLAVYSFVTGEDIAVPVLPVFAPDPHGYAGYASWPDPVGRARGAAGLARQDGSMRYAVFVTTIALSDEAEPDGGVSIFGLTNDEDIADAASEAFAELNAQDGPSVPWLVNEDQLAAIEAALPAEKFQYNAD